MAWMRLDDGFTRHPKFEGWTPAQRWAWLETMEYCARYRTGGRIPTDLSLLPRSVTRALLTRAEAAGWCNRREDGALWINDWDEFNPGDKTGAERQARHREKARKKAAHRAVAEAVENGSLVRQPCEVCGSTYHVVAHHEDYAKPLEVAWLCRIHHAERHAEIDAAAAEAEDSNGDRNVTRNVTSNVRERDGNGSSRAGARARSRPVPSPEPEEPAAALATPQTAAALARLADLGIDPADVSPIHGQLEPDLVLAWCDLAEREATTNPAGFVVAGVRTGQPPANRTSEPEPDPRARRERWMRDYGWRMDPIDAGVHLLDMGAEPDEVAELLELATTIRTEAA